MGIISQLMGIIKSGEVRLPMTQMDAPSLEKLTAEMKTVGLL